MVVRRGFTRRSNYDFGPFSGPLGDQLMVDQRNIRRGVTTVAVSFILFGTLAIVGMLLTRAAQNVAIFWPANAAMVGLGLVLGRQYLPHLLLGAVTAIHWPSQSACHWPMRLKFR
jgi:hypothetical protein